MGGFKELKNHSNRPLTKQQGDATDEVFPRFAAGHEYRDQVISEFLDLDPLPPLQQTRDSPLPTEVDRARRAILNVVKASNRTESNVEQRVKQVYENPVEKDTVIARFANDLVAIEEKIAEKGTK